MADEECPSEEKPHLLKPLRRFRCLFILIIVSHIICVNCTEVNSACNDCDQGSCENNTCVCLPGWRGTQCNECYGRIRLNPGKEGIIHDGSGPYSQDSTCSWLLDAGEEGLRVTLKINSLATECIWDHIYIHNGDSAFAPLVAAYSGFLWGRKENPYLQFKMKGRYAFIHFYSDAALTLPGFNISYVMDNCSVGCSENGICNVTACECKPGWAGENCDIALNGCPNNCSGDGDCVKDSLGGYVCISSRGTLVVEKMPQIPFDFSGRGSLALVAERNESLWIMGGYRMGIHAKANNLFKFDLTSRMWQRPLETGDTPWPRYGHSGVFYNDDLFLFGGVSYTEVKSDLWKFSIDENRWEELNSAPRNLSGHAAHVYRDVMIVIFGFSPDFGYSGQVLEYDFVLKTWEVVETTGSRVEGGYGHSSIFDERTMKIYVFGGHLNNGGSYKLSDKLYEYDPATKAWYILKSSGKALYLHSGFMMNGLMFIYGGNPQNDTRAGKQTKCFASDFMAYDRSCNKWHVVPTPGTDARKIELDRFGQAFVSIDNIAYMFGGFNAVIKDDLLKITAGDCSFHDSRIDCEAAFPGRKCQWNGTSCLAQEITGSCPEPVDVNTLCLGYNRCDICKAASTCHWCAGKCIAQSQRASNNCTQEAPNCTVEAYKECGLAQTCITCEDLEQCIWQSGECKSLESVGSGVVKGQCERSPCKGKTTCSSCTKSPCMWCSSLNQCIDTNAYVVYYFYGQCMDWTTKKNVCEVNSCSKQKTCADCQSRPRCGWCDDESGTGTGFCSEGGMEGPFDLKDGSYQRDAQKCPARSWYFDQCPLCQCNGHSLCVNGTDKCESCQSHTTGSQCQTCENGYFGDALNGGNCSVCSCNGQADSCHPETGDCYCKTRGVIGKKCDKCDEDYKYPGDSNNGGICYYTLTTDYQYTFNLSKKEDRNYSQINFLNSPTSSDRDVDFTLNCSSPALINITYRSRSFPQEKDYVTAAVCDYFRQRFEHKDFAFGGKENTTFLVYVYDFKTPFKLQVS